MRYKFESGRVQSLMAYVTLKQLLRKNYGIEGNPIFKEGEHGKPEIVEIEGIDNGFDLSRLSFNFSHCKNGVACAVNHRSEADASDKSPAVGIDIECIPKEIKEDLCRYVFNEKEVEQVLTSNKPCVEFARLWTMKEALVKLSGIGIRDKDQLRSLLNQKEKYSFITEVNEEKGWVMTVVTN